MNILRNRDRQIVSLLRELDVDTAAVFAGADASNQSGILKSIQAACHCSRSHEAALGERFGLKRIRRPTLKQGAEYIRVAGADAGIGGELDDVLAPPHAESFDPYCSLECGQSLLRNDAAPPG